MFKFVKPFFATIFSVLLISFSFSLGQHSVPSGSSSSHSQYEEHNKQNSGEQKNNMNNHQHSSISETLTEKADIKFTLAASQFEQKRIFVGVSSNIKGQINPVLELPQNAVVEITLLNDTVLQHNFVIPDLAFHSEHVSSSDAVTFTFRADLESGSSYPYYCTVANHNQEGMEGVIAIK